MFRLSDATRRLMTLGIFFLLCVVPTIVMISLGIWRRLPGRVSTEAHRLSLLIGHPVRLDSARQLSPSTVLYKGLEILDPESNKLLLHCDRARARFETIRREGEETARRELKISADRATITAPSLDAFHPLVERLLQCRIEGAPSAAQLNVKQIVLRQPEYEFPARVDVTLKPEQSRIELQFRLQEQSKPVYLCVVRNREYDPPVDGFQLVSGDEGALPGPLLSAFLPMFSNLGPAAQFRGHIVANRVPDHCRRIQDGTKFDSGWQLDAMGYLSNIDLPCFVGDYLPHEISGTGSVRLEKLEILSGRISVLKGGLHATAGRISRDLVASCVEQFGLSTNFAIHGPTSLLAYDELAVGFHLDGAGLRLEGECQSEPKGAMLAAYTYRLDAPRSGSIPPTKAIAALTSTPESQLATSRYASRLARHMPYIPTASAITIAAPPLDGRSGARH